MTSSDDLADLRGLKITAIIQARMTSSRLPGKVLADIGGVPLLTMMVRRLQRAQTVDSICLATTLNRSDDPLIKLADDMGISWFRGSENDVLERVLLAAQREGTSVIVETTGDCPFIDPSLLDACVFAYFATNVHFASNCILSTLPRGTDVKVFSTETLAEVAGLTEDAADHEHVSLYIYEHPERYTAVTLRAFGRLRRPEWRWTVDTAEDLDFVRAVVSELGHDFSTIEAVTLLESRPDLVAINKHVRQKPVR
jgi:spore coat polysaccharide biosynthesis protein SpsF